jgi:hypothetical protein
VALVAALLAAVFSFAFALAIYSCGLGGFFVELIFFSYFIN